MAGVVFALVLPVVASIGIVLMVAFFAKQAAAPDPSIRYEVVCGGERYVVDDVSRSRDGTILYERLDGRMTRVALFSPVVPCSAVRIK